jgi:hypothetical protein
MIWLRGRQPRGSSLTARPRRLEIKSSKTVWIMGHKIRPARADRDAADHLAGLIEMHDPYCGAPQPGTRGRGAAGQATVGAAVERPDHKPRFAPTGLVAGSLRPWYRHLW